MVIVKNADKISEEHKVEEKGKLEILASITIQESEDLYKVVDFLNRTLKEKRVIFGLKKVKNEPKMTLYIYEI